MAGQIDEAIFDAIYRGHRFHKPKGERTFIAEKLWIDRTFQAHYNFVHIYVRMRNEKTNKTELVRWNEFQDNWVRVNPISNEDKLREQAIDDVLGIPWYRQ